METILEKLQFRAMTYPDGVCYTYLEEFAEESNLTCRQLDHAAKKIALELLQHAVPGDRVLLLLPSGLEYLQSFWGCLYAGMIAVPLYPPKAKDKTGKIKHIIEDCQPTLAIVQGELATELVRELGADAVHFLTFADIDTTIDNTAPVDRLLPEVDSNSIALLQYSSGSTGNPKGGMISHGNILANLRVLEVETKSNGQDVFVGWLPLFHDMGLVMSVLMAMYVGARSILFSPLKFAKNPLFWMQVISRYHGTISGAPNFAYETCARKFSAAALGDTDLSSWRLALNGAEPVRPETLSKFFGAYSPLGFKETAFMPSYGMAEATVFLCGGALLTPPRILAADRDELQSGVFTPADGASSKSLSVVSCGAPPVGHDIIVVNDSEVLAEGQAGEVWVKGASIASGYWGRPEESQAVFQAFTRNGDGPYLRTGDLGFIEGGELFVLGRLKDVLIVQGRNIHAHDVEACVRTSLSANTTGDAAAFGIDGAGTEDIVLLLEIRPRFMAASFESIAADIRASVFASFGVLISEIVFARVGTVMKTTSGKVMRRAMRDRYAENSIDALHVSRLDLSSEEYVPLSTDTELRLAKLWAELLAVSNVHASSNFLQLGGNSLTIARMIANISSQWNVDLPLKRVFEHPILSTLAAFIDQAASSANVLRSSDFPQNTDVAPLSFQQRRLWFMAQMGSDVGANENISVAIRFTGAVDTAAVNRAFSAIVERHETLRTRFCLDGSGNPVQLVAPVQAFELTSVDLSAGDSINAEHALQSCIRQEVDKRFDLTCDLLQRVCLIHLAVNEHVLLLSVHHIAVDGWSLGILVKELSALYGEYVEGRPHSLPPLKIRYRDYACWQAGQPQSDKFASDAQYWRNQLAGIPAVHGLPVDCPRKSSQGFYGATLRTSIDAGTTSRFHSLCARNAATLFMGLHAAFSVLLSRLSNEATIVVGTAVANRDSAELHELIGLFANIVVLRSELSADASFCDVLQQSRQTALDAYDHQSFPFEKLVEMLQPQRSLGVTPLFQVMLLLQDNECPAVDLPGLSVSSAEEVDTFAKFDLTLSVRETGQGLQLTWKYDAGLFNVATIERIAAGFSILMEEILRSPTSNVSTLPLLSQQDRHYLLHTLNATQAVYPQDKCIHELFEEQVENTPNHSAVVYEDERLTYAELNERANRLAHHLRESGVQADTLVGLCVERSVEMVVGLLGVLKAGGAYVPLDPGYPRERLTHMIEDSGVQLLLTQQALLEKTRQLAGRWRELQIVSLDGAELQATLQQYSVDNPRRQEDQSAHNLAYVIYTSGSTGVPKGAMNEHRAVVNRLHWMQERYALDTQDRVLQKTPFSFDVSVWEFFWPLLTGAQLIVARPEGHKDPIYLTQLIQQRGVTRLHFVPSMLQAFLEQYRSGDCASLRQIVCSGEELSSGLLSRCRERLPQVRLSNLYGPTETAIEVTSWECGVQDESTRVPIGRPIANIRIYILGADRQPVPVGVTGEICIGGVGVGRGYLNRPELTAERFVHDPFSGQAEGRMYRTGDLGRWRADGVIEYLGRNDHQVKIRGFRIELGEIENQLMQHAQVRAAVALATEGAGGEKRLVAYVTREQGGDSNPALVAGFKASLERTLPEYMVPALFVVLDELPLTSSGKIDRKALPAPQASLLAIDYVAPQTPTEQTLVEICAELLQLRSEEISTTANFFALGGHSLQVVQLVSSLQQAGLKVDVRTIYGAASLRALAATLEDAASAEHLAFSAPANGIPPACDRIEPGMLPLVSLSEEEIERIVATVPGGARNVQDIYPLVPLQEGILFSHLMHRHNDPYILRAMFSVSNQPQFEALISALQWVVDRHDVLRTAVVSENVSRSVQVVYRRADLPVETIELDPARDTVSQMQARFDEPQVMDITRAPLLRARTAKDPHSERCLLLLQLHHMVSDHVGLETIRRELGAYLSGEVEALTEPVAYREFVAHALHQARHSDAQTFFSKMIGDVTEPTAPFNLLDVHGDGTQTVEARKSLDAALAKRIRQTARDHRFSPAVLFHTAWATVVAACSGRSDVVFGTVLSGRLQGTSGVQDMLGMFINTLPLRVRLAGMSVVQMAEQVGSGLRDLLPYEQIPLSLVQRCSGLAVNASLFSALLNYRHSQSWAGQLAEAGDAGITLIHAQERSNYPFIASIDDLAEEFSIDVQVDRSIDPHRVIGYLEAALTGIIGALQEQPETSILSLSVVPESERHYLLHTLNATQAVYPQDKCIHELFEEQVEKTPNHSAVVYEDHRLTYAELNARANQLAHHLREAGVQADTLVGLCVERSLEMVVGLLGILKAGGAYVPLDPGYPRERLTHMIEDSGVQLLLTQQALLEKARQLAGRRRELQILSLDGAELQATLQQYSVDNPRRQVAQSAHNLAYVIYTSGSTGVPKGAMNEHRAVVNRLHWMQERYALDTQDRVLQKTPFSFDVSVWEFFWPLLTGAQLIVARPEGHKDPIYLTQLIQQRGVTRLHFVPSMLQAFLEQHRSGDCASLRQIVCSGEELSSGLLSRCRERLPQVRLSNLYGPTETAIDVTSWECGVQDESTRVPIGRPIANIRIYILGADRQPVPVGVMGEICIGGVGVGRGYLNRPELTAERFVHDPFSGQAEGRMYRTGDLGRWRADGVIEYLGRNDHQVKIRGFRIELGEIENQLMQHAQVRAAVVLATEGAGGEKRLVAYVTLEQGGDSNPALIAGLKASLERTLPEYMVPALFVALDELPLTSSGKIDRKALPAPHASLLAIDYVAPQTPTEQALVEICAELLQLRSEEISTTANFFALGGHSLLLVQFMMSVKSTFNVQLGMKEIFSHTNVHSIARSIDALQRKNQLTLELLSLPDNELEQAEF